jgi:FAD/FMN-containing dehydrogenase
MSSTAFASSALRLAEHLRGSVVLPGDASWDAARQPWNVAVEQRPGLVVVPEGVDDVVAAVRFAAERGLRVAVQGTGHGAAAREPMDDGVLLLSMARMSGAQVDHRALRARVQGGALWESVTEQAAPRGLAALHGSSPDVGVVGYTLGGGIGWLARKHGLAANSVTAAEVVLADGRVVYADAEREPELFWALRGGGGSFGVVTALEFDLYPVDRIYAGWLAWPWERAGEVLEAWHAWTQTAPDEVTSVGRVLQLPPVEALPEGLRGRKLVVVEAAYLGEYEDGSRLLWPLRRLAPQIDTFGMVSPAALSTLHRDPLGPTPAIGDGALLDAMPAAGIEALVEAIGPGSGSPLVAAGLRHLGGALRREAPGAGALATLEAEYAYYGVGVPVTPEVAAAIGRHHEAVAAALAPWEADRAYRNFAERAAGRSFNGADADRRLQAVRAQYDPRALFQAAHEVPAA